MPTKRPLIHFWGARQVDLLFEATLLPEDRYRTTDLHMADQLALANDQYLFFLYEIGHITLIIDTTGVIARTCTIPFSTGDQSELRIFLTNLTARLFKVALDQRSEPARVDLLPYKVAVKRQIPEIFMVTGD